MVIISDLAIVGVVIPIGKLTTLSKLDTMVSKGIKVVITGMLSDNGQKLPYVVTVIISLQ